MKPIDIEETSLLWSINEGLTAKNTKLLEELHYYKEALHLAKEANKFLQQEIMEMMKNEI